jgi:hypothetical protein
MLMLLHQIQLETVIDDRFISDEELSRYFSDTVTTEINLETLPNIIKVKYTDFKEFYGGSAIGHEVTAIITKDSLEKKKEQYPDLEIVNENNLPKSINIPGSKL